MLEYPFFSACRRTITNLDLAGHLPPQALAWFQEHEPEAHTQEDLQKVRFWSGVCPWGLPLGFAPGCSHACMDAFFTVPGPMASYFSHTRGGT